MFFSNLQPSEQVCFDLSNINWICPVLLLPICAYIYETNSKYVLPINNSVKSYINTINFPSGVQTISEDQKYHTYIPIVFLQKVDSIDGKEKLESWFQELVYHNMKIKGNKNAIFAPITELITNIFEHSGKSHGWVLAQIYPFQNYVDVCIVDTGRGIKQCYEEELNMKLNSHLEAFEMLANRESSKSNKERGYGIYMSKKLICKALDGNFVLLSGNAGWNIDSDSSNMTEIANFYWQGVIASYRINFPNKQVDFYDFLE